MLIAVGVRRETLTKSAPANLQSRRISSAGLTSETETRTEGRTYNDEVVDGWVSVATIVNALVETVVRAAAGRQTKACTDHVSLSEH